ncbi:MAG: lyase family protein, partial [Kiritimatiellales bacterium]
MKTQKTTVGTINQDVLAFTAGRDVELDMNLIQADCIGTAAHVTMLSKMKVKPAIITEAERKKVIAELKAIIALADAGKFKIRLADQDVHLAVERTLTEKLGDLGKKVHTCRSRNDQVAVDLRLYAREEILGTLDEAAALISALLAFAKKHEKVPMVGRTHMQPG